MKKNHIFSSYEIGSEKLDLYECDKKYAPGKKGLISKEKHKFRRNQKLTPLLQVIRLHATQSTLRVPLTLYS